MVFEKAESLLAKDFDIFINKHYAYDKDKPLILYENQQMDFSKIDRKWIFFSSKITHRNSTSLGLRKKYQRKGIIFISIGIPSGEGTYDMQEIIECIVNHYEGQRLSNMVFTEISVEQEPTKQKEWYLRNIIIHFKYWITK